MFPIVPDQDSPEAPQDGAVDRPQALPRAEGQIAPDTFVVPPPAPDLPKPSEIKMAPATESNFTHYVHLADGRVLRANLSEITEHYGSRYYENRGEDNETSTGIIGVYSR